MKEITALLIFSGTCFAQATVPIQAIPQEVAVSLSIAAEGVAAIDNFAKTIAPTGVSPTTLATPITAQSTNIAGNLASTTGLAAGMGLKIDSEFILINPDLTVTRGAFLSTASAHLAGAVVTPLRSGNYSEFLTNALVDVISQLVIQYPGPAVRAQQSAIATAQAAITALQTAGATHK